MNTTRSLELSDANMFFLLTPDAALQCKASRPSCRFPNQCILYTPGTTRLREDKLLKYISVHALAAKNHRVALQPVRHEEHQTSSSPPVNQVILLELLLVEPTRVAAAGWKEEMRKSAPCLDATAKKKLPMFEKHGTQEYRMLGCCCSCLLIPAHHKIL